MADVYVLYWTEADGKMRHTSIVGGFNAHSAQGDLIADSTVRDVRLSGPLTDERATALVKGATPAVD